LPDNISFLSLQQFFELVGRRMRDGDRIFCFSQTPLPRGPLEVSNDLISSNAANEPGEFLSFSNVSTANLFKDDTEALLVEIIRERGVTDVPADDTHYDKVITLDQFNLSLLIARSNAADELRSSISNSYRHGFH
jgi:hypothetical protein